MNQTRTTTVKFAKSEQTAAGQQREDPRCHNINSHFRRKSQRQFNRDKARHQQWKESKRPCSSVATAERHLNWVEGSVARISNDYMPQLPVVGKDIPGPAVPCHVGTARSLDTASNRTGSARRAVRRSYSDSEESDNDVVYADQHDNTVQQVSLRHNRLTPTAVDW